MVHFRKKAVRVAKVGLILAKNLLQAIIYRTQRCRICKVYNLSALSIIRAFTGISCISPHQPTHKRHNLLKLKFCYCSSATISTINHNFSSQKCQKSGQKLFGSGKNFEHEKVMGVPRTFVVGRAFFSASLCRQKATRGPPSQALQF